MSVLLTKKVAIIGAGLAGLSLATELADEGFEVHVYEKNHYLGGRASDLVDRKMHDAVPIGPHVYVQWYNNFFHFLHKIRAKRSIEWERSTLLEVVNAGKHYAFKFYKLPAPLFSLPWIAFFPLLSLRDKLSNLRLMGRIYFSSLSRIEKLDAGSAKEYLVRSGVSERSIELFWRFIVLSLLNVPLEECSAAEFAMLAKRWAYLERRKFGFPKIGLGDVYADEAERYLIKRGGRVHRNSPVIGVELANGSIRSLRVEKDGAPIEVVADVYVSTLDPIQLRALMREALDLATLGVLDRVAAVPYLSVNLWFKEKITHKMFWAMLSGNGRQYLNTDFYDFSNIYGDHKGGSYVASNVINSGEFAALSDQQVIDRTLAEIHETFPKAPLRLVHAHVHRTPYVIYAPRPGSRALKDIRCRQLPNLFITGDWSIRELPQCMESAVRSGYKCAEEVLRAYGVEKRICDDRVY